MSALGTEYSLKNPFDTTKQARRATIYDPNEYRLHLLACSLSALALRALLVMAAHVEADGLVRMKRTEIARVMKKRPEQIGKAISELVRFGFVARCTLFTYWLSPDLFRSITVEL